MDLVAGWNNLWGAVSGGGKLGVILAAVGVAIIVFAVLSWLWKKRNGGGGGMSGFPWMMILLGAILAGPSVVIPLILMIAQVIINIVIGLMTWVAA